MLHSTKNRSFIDIDTSKKAAEYIGNMQPMAKEGETKLENRLGSSFQEQSKIASKIMSQYSVMEWDAGEN